MTARDSRLDFRDATYDRKARDLKCHLNQIRAKDLGIEMN